MVATEEQVISASGVSLKLHGNLDEHHVFGDATKRAVNPDLNVLGIEAVDLFDLWSIPINNLNKISHPTTR